MNSLKTYVLRSRYDYDGSNDIPGNLDLQPPPTSKNVDELTQPIISPKETTKNRTISDIANIEQPEETLILNKFEEEFSKLIKRLEDVKIYLNGGSITLPNSVIIHDAYNVIMHLLTQNTKRPENIDIIAQFSPEMFKSVKVNSDKMQLRDVIPWISIKKK